MRLIEPISQHCSHVLLYAIITIHSGHDGPSHYLGTLRRYYLGRYRQYAAAGH